MEKNVLTTLTVSSIVQLVEVIIMTVSQLLFEWQFVTICLAFLLFLMYVYSGSHGKEHFNNTYSVLHCPVTTVEIIIMTVSQLLFEWQFIVTICLAFLLFLMYVYSLNFPACQGSYPYHAFQLLHGPALTLLLSVIWLLLLIHASEPCSSLLDASFDPITVHGAEELGMFSSSMSRWNKTQFI